MCPSYRVTRDEQHATRGRARLLFEMLEGRPLDEGWHSEAVKSALELCLACKGCKGDCPVNVDMATYKAEFLAHYYAGKRRPMWAYAFGLIMYWAHLGSPLARALNAVSQTPGLDVVAKALVRMAPERRIPPFSERSFRRGIASTVRTTVPTPAGSASSCGRTRSTTHFHAPRLATHSKCSKPPATTS